METTTDIEESTPILAEAVLPEKDLPEPSDADEAAETSIKENENADETVEIIPQNSMEIQTPQTVEQPKKFLVSNLPADISDTELRDLFTNCGKIESLETMVDNAGITCSMVTFDVESNTKNVLLMSQTMFKDKRVRVDRLDAMFRYDNLKTIIVRNLPEKTSEEEIYNIFRKFGEIENVEKTTPEEAYIAFKFDSDACDAMDLRKTVRGSELLIMEYVKYKRTLSDRFGAKRKFEEYEDSKNKKFKQNPKIRLFVGNTPAKTTEEEIREHFGKYGTIEGVTFAQHPVSCIHKCYVDYADEKACLQACEMNQTLFKDHRLRVARFLDEHTKFTSRNSTAIVASGLEPGISEEKIYDFFSSCGEIHHVRRITVTSAVISFTNAESVKKAVKIKKMGDHRITMSAKSLMHEMFQLDQIVFVMFLPLQKIIRKKAITKMFKHCGNIIKSFTEDRLGNNANILLLYFQTADEANKALDMNGKRVKGYSLIVKPAERSKLPKNLKLELDKTTVSSTRNAFETSEKAILVGNMPRAKRETDIKQYFSQYGAIESVWLLNKRTKTEDAYIDFSTKEEAESVFEHNGRKWDGHILYIRWAKDADVTDENRARTIVVKHYPLDACLEDLHQHFSEMGEIEFARIGGQHLILSFKTEAAAANALEHKTFRGKDLSVKLVRENFKNKDFQMDDDESSDKQVDDEETSNNQDQEITQE